MRSRNLSVKGTQYTFIRSLNLRVSGDGGRRALPGYADTAGNGSLLQRQLRIAGLGDLGQEVACEGVSGSSGIHDVVALDAYCVTPYVSAAVNGAF